MPRLSRWGSQKRSLRTGLVAQPFQGLRMVTAAAARHRDNACVRCRRTLARISAARRRAMGMVSVRAFSISIDGFGAGPRQSLENPLGAGGKALHEWIFATRTFRRMCGEEGGSTGVDDAFAARSFENVGAWIMGRNMFGPVRGPWPDAAWKGWWGASPPFHVPVFVLTHHPRDTITMEGGTTFRFVADGIEAALERARAAADGKDIRIGGGATTIQQYLRAGLVDEVHLAIAPVVLGSGERLFTDVDMAELGYRCVERASAEKAVHVVLRK